jgi:competence ComEA-like helix-hairpin-helix protein
MFILEKQIKGLVAIFLFLAIITFISFFYHSFFDYKTPDYADQSSTNLPIIVVLKNVNRGVYFMAPQSTFHQLMQSIGIHSVTYKDFVLKSGTRIEISSDSDNRVKTLKIDNVDRLALEMPININQATEENLILIPGIGEKTAQNILEYRKKIGRFNTMEELTQIKGIKAKKLMKLRRYLYLE